MLNGSWRLQFNFSIAGLSSWPSAFILLLDNLKLCGWSRPRSLSCFSLMALATTRVASMVQKCVKRTTGHLNRCSRYVKDQPSPSISITTRFFRQFLPQKINVDRIYSPISGTLTISKPQLNYGLCGRCSLHNKNIDFTIPTFSDSFQNHSHQCVLYQM